MRLALVTLLAVGAPACSGGGPSDPSAPGAPMASVPDKHRAAIEGMLEPGERLEAVVFVSTGTGIGQVAGRDTTLHGVADYLRENGLTALGIPAPGIGAASDAFDSGWIAVTDRRIAFVVRGFWWATPKAIAYDLPPERISLRWRDDTSLGVTTRLYHLTYTHTNGKSLDLVRRGDAGADADAFVAALGSRAARM